MLHAKLRIFGQNKKSNFFLQNFLHLIRKWWVMFLNEDDWLWKQFLDQDKEKIDTFSSRIFWGISDHIKLSFYWNERFFLIEQTFLKVFSSQKHFLKRTLNQGKSLIKNNSVPQYFLIVEDGIFEDFLKSFHFFSNILSRT